MSRAALSEEQQVSLNPTTHPEATEPPGAAEPPTAAPQRVAVPDLAVRQIAAIDSFNRARAAARLAGAAASAGREARLDAARRMDVLRRQHGALVARTQAALDAGHELLLGGRPRCVLAHRDPWFLDRVADALLDQGFAVVARLDNGADAVGAVVAEQPDLLLLGDPVPMMTGHGVVAEALRWSPRTFVAVQTADPGAREELVAAGVGSVFGRSVPPADVASGLADALTARSALARAGLDQRG